MAIGTYDACRDTLQFFNDSYVGGQQYKYPATNGLANATIYETRISEDAQASLYRVPVKSYTSYLVPHEAESVERFEARVKFSAHLPLTRPIVDAYAESVTANVDRQLGQLSGMLEDVDNLDTPYASFVDAVAKQAATDGWTYVVCDTNNVVPKAFLVHARKVAWVQTDDDTNAILEFAYVMNASYALHLAPSAQQVKIRVWNQDGWYNLEGAVDLGKGNLLGARSSLRVTDNGPLPPQLKGELPVVTCFYERDRNWDIPKGISLISGIVDTEMQIYNELSWVIDFHQKANIATLTIPENRADGHLPAHVKRELGSTKALPYSSQTGSPGWIHPSSEPTKESREHCDWLIQKALDAVGLGSANNTSNARASGISLVVNSREFESRAKRFGNQMQRFERGLLTKLARLAGVGETGISVTYPTEFTLPDVRSKIDNALSVLRIEKDLELDIGTEAKLDALMQAITTAMPTGDANKIKRIRDSIASNLDADGKMVSMFRDKKVKELTPEAETPAVETPDVSEESKPQLYQYDYESGIIMVNEARAFKGLGPIPGGDVPVAQWQAQYKANETAKITEAQVSASDGSEPPAEVIG